jgi:moderate conductance mechanosensitive channel
MEFLTLDQATSFALSWFLAHGLKILFILLGAWILTKIFRKTSETIIRKAVPPDNLNADAEKKREDTLIKIFNAGLRIIVWSITVIMILPEFGINIAPILAGAGVVGLAIGFGTQHMVRDFFAGLFVILENQYRVGDVACLDDTCGLVENITLRKVILRDLDAKVHHIPHGTVNKVTNLTIGFSRAHLNIGVAYKENLDHVMQVLNKVGKEMAEDEKWKQDFIKPIEVVGVDDFADSAIIIKVLGDTKPMRQWDVMREYRKRVKVTFDQEGIEIPFPQRTVWMKKEGE